MRFSRTQCRVCWASSDSWLCPVFHVPSTVQKDLNYTLSYRHCEILSWPIYRWEETRGTQQCGSKSSGNYSAVGFQLRSLSTQHPLITLFCFSKMSGETDSRLHYQKATVEWRFHHSLEPSGPLAACPTSSPPVAPSPEDEALDNCPPEFFLDSQTSILEFSFLEHGIHSPWLPLRVKATLG